MSRNSALLKILLGLAVVSLASCRSRPALADAQSSAETLAAAVLTALASSDRDAVQRLALNEEEFKAYVWPDLPAARPERNMPFSFVWGDLNQKSRTALAATVARHGGRPYQLVSVRFDGETTRYSMSTVHRRTVVTVRAADGTQEELRVYGSSLQTDAGWKVFSFVTD